MYKLRILSLGAGVQSTTLFLMACDGLIPKFDAAIFADTGWESAHTYQLLHELKQKGDGCGIKIITVKAGDVRDVRYKSYPVLMPFYLKNKDGKCGMARRFCTSEVKTNVIVKEIRSMLGLQRYQRADKDSVEMVIGFSFDEIQRSTLAKKRLIVFSFPLITDLKMTREDCEMWLFVNYPHLRVRRSACIGCPYKNNSEWSELKYKRPEEWIQAVEYDKQIRDSTDLFVAGFLHKSRIPLQEADLSIIEKPNQLELFETCKDQRGIEIIKTMVETL